VETTSTAALNPVVDSTWARREITVETDDFRAVLTNEGAGLISFVMKPSRGYLPEETELIPAGGAPRPGFRFWTYAGPFDTDKLKFNLLADSTTTEIKLSGEEKQTVEFSASVGSGRMIGYTFMGKVTVSSISNRED
jgi:hypothetical protein